MKASRRIPIRLVLLMSMGFAAGCQSTGPVVQTSAPVFDPCAERLHEVSGQLLLYYSANQKLPASLDELRTVMGDEADKMCICPESGETYIYRPEGFPLPDVSGTLVLYDAVPVHNAGRWGIVVNSSAPRTPLTAGVVWINETVISSLPEVAGPSEKVGEE